MSARNGGRARQEAEAAAAAEKDPLYARVLRLKHIAPGPWWCFLFLEGSLAVAGVLVLADWVNLWGLIVLPIAVAAAVKINDLVAGALPAPAPAAERSPSDRSPSETRADSLAAAKTTASTRSESTPVKDKA